MSEGGRRNDDSDPTEEAVRRALIDATQPVPSESVDWGALRSRVLDGAAERLDRLAEPDGASRWYTHAARWTPVAAPAAAAACLVLTLAMPRTEFRAAGATSAEEPVAGISSPVEELPAEDVADAGSLTLVLVGDEGGELLLWAAFGPETDG